MKRVYIAGAYSGSNILECLTNIGKGEQLATKVFLDGHAPFTPWHDKDFVMREPNYKFTVPMFYEFSIKWLEVSDCILLVKDNWKHSKGTLREIEIAKELGIPIFEDYEKFKEWSESYDNIR